MRGCAVNRRGCKERKPQGQASGKQSFALIRRGSKGFPDFGALSLWRGFFFFFGTSEAWGREAWDVELDLLGAVGGHGVEKGSGVFLRSRARCPEMVTTGFQVGKRPAEKCGAGQYRCS